MSFMLSRTGVGWRSPALQAGSVFAAGVVAGLVLCLPNHAIGFERRVHAFSCMALDDKAVARVDSGALVNIIGGSSHTPVFLMCPVPSDRCLYPSAVTTLHAHGHIYENNVSVKVSACISYFAKSAPGGQCGAVHTATGIGPYVAAPNRSAWAHNDGFPYLWVELGSNSGATASKSELRGFYMAGNGGDSTARCD
jgi:hypothetical protein